MAKERIDSLLVARGLVETREKAKALIMAGQVLVGEQKVVKAGARVDAESPIRLLSAPGPYVSRGGIKLAHALDTFAIDVTGQECLDLGSSTGGFTDCLLQRGAVQVWCVDVGRGQLHWRIRSDPRVTVLEGYNARYLDAGDFPGAAFGRVVMDLSFISLRLILPPLKDFLALCGAGTTEVVALVKPQFEAGPQDVGKGGIVRSEAVRARVLEEVSRAAAAAGFGICGRTPSPITGADGNVEYLLHLRHSGSAP
jgi:23S rRNA (cytidine1920-2'-O)/16S rRNA (cytidine1409-2'-O)-methyltransferase